MSPRQTAQVALALVAPLLFSACATKGYVRTQVAAAKASTDAAIQAEQSARIAGDKDLSERIVALRADLDSLRSQFGARIAQMEDGLRFAMPVTFAFDDASVSATARPMLERFAKVAKKYYPTSTITIEGFADPSGSQSYNLALSRRRAENVRIELTSLGLDGNPLRAVGYGESRLVIPDAAKDEPGAEINRRVVFVIENAGREAGVALGPSR
ncbi:MAG TPA: OmpA family protein [Gemmatimonadaceae bacterium]|nr:OmpA family protein [Gemmatimonadaceae bacterium]